MKISKKIIALLLVMMLALSALCAMSVFAEEIDVSDEELAALLGGEYDGEDVEFETESSTDVSATDFSATDLISALGLHTETIEHYGFSILVPDGGELYSLESDDLAVYNAINYSKMDLLSNYNLIALCQDENEQEGYVFYYELSYHPDSPYAKVTGDYADLSQDKLNDIIATKEAQGKANGYEYDSVYAVRSGGQQYVIARIDQNNADGHAVTQAEISTAINGDYYDLMLYIQHGGSVKDLDTVSSIIKSAKIDGETKTADCAKTFAIIAFILGILLLIVVALLVFFIIRFSAYSKASNSRFNIIGFDMPKTNTKDNE